MLHILKRHPIPIAAHFEQVLVLTYAFPSDVLSPLLTPGLELDTFDGLGFLAVATVQTRDLRPAFLPRIFGQDFFLTGYRIFTRFKMGNGRVLRGLKILRSDTDRRSMVAWGNRLTRYGYRRADIEAKRENGLFHLRVQTPDAEADLDILADVGHMPAALPEGSPFPDVETARRFAGPLPHTFDYEAESHSMIIVRGRRSNWLPQPVAVEVRQNNFIASGLFRGTEPTLANAFYLENVPYGWERGWRERLSRP